jgi:hypothetical protein
MLDVKCKSCGWTWDIFPKGKTPGDRDDVEIHCPHCGEVLFSAHTDVYYYEPRLVKRGAKVVKGAKKPKPKPKPKRGR